MGWMERRNQELEDAWRAKNDPTFGAGAGGFHILILPLYGPPVAVLLYPLATLAMLATALLLDGVGATLRIPGAEGLPVWKLIPMVGVFLFVFRIDSRLGLRRGYYWGRHAVRLLVWMTLSHIVLVRETTGLDAPGAMALLAGLADGGHVLRLLVVAGLGHLILRSYVLRVGWSIALVTWRVRPHDYRPEFLTVEGSVFHWIRQRKERRLDRKAAQFDEIWERVTKPEP